MTQQAPSTNGKFDLFYRSGWAHLTVRPPVGAGRPVYPEEVENRMRLLGIPRVRAKVIRDAIEEASGEAIPLVEWPAGRNLVAAISVGVAEDGMSASVAVQAPKVGAAPPTLDDVLEELARAGVVHGIDREGIARALARRSYGVSVPAAAGTAPVGGRTKRVRYLFNVNRGKPYLEMDFGRINLKELNFIDNRQKGELLAELEPAVPAVDGRKVTGEPVPAETEGGEAALRPGQNTVLSEDGTKLYAGMDGNVRLAGTAVVVEPVITVKNVNYETGNIRFDGSVVIEGGIADGFVVEAGGDIQVGSGVGRATLVAAGSIVLKTGINGNGEGRIECGGDLFAKYLESCTVVCRGSVLAEEAIMHSKVTAERHCVMSGRRSEVIASDLVVGGCFWCKKLGNFNEAPTRVYLGVPPDLLKEYRETAGGIELKQEEWDKAERQAEQLGKLLHDSKDDLRVRQAAIQVQEALDRIGRELAELRGRFPRLRERVVASRDSFAVVEETMFKGAAASFGTLEYRPPDAGIRKLVLRAGEREILESGFNYHERPAVDFGEHARL